MNRRAVRCVCRFKRGFQRIFIVRQMSEIQCKWDWDHRCCLGAEFPGNGETATIAAETGDFNGDGKPRVSR